MSGYPYNPGPDPSYEGPDRRHAVDSRVGAVEEGIKNVQRSLETLTLKMERNNESLETKVDRLIEASVRLHTDAENDKEIAKSQALGLLDLSNRQTLTDREMNSIKTEVAVMKQENLDLLKMLKSEREDMEKRTATNRFMIVAVGIAASVVNYVIGFLTQHYK